jgi:hypothetical protein
LIFIYPIYKHNWRNISTIYIYIYINIYKTRLASNEIFSPSNKIHREVGRAKDLSAPLYNLYVDAVVLLARVLGNRVPSRIFGPKRGKVTGDWRKLPNEVRHDLYCCRHNRVIKCVTSLAGHVARIEEINSSRGLLEENQTQETSWKTWA